MKTPDQLYEEILNTEIETGQLAVWWLGQHSFVIKTESKTLALDPFITPSDRRNTPPLLHSEHFKGFDIVFGTHDHGDHIDRPRWPEIAESAPEIQFVVPEILREKLSEELNIPLQRFVGVEADETKEVVDISIKGIKAAHELLDPDPKTGQYSFLGFVIRIDGFTIYHSGDTCIYEGLQTQLKEEKPDLMMIPINGRDAERLARGCIGNMTWQEAVDLAGAIKPTLVIPTHYDMFTKNSQDPQPFLDYLNVKYPDVPGIIPIHGEKITIEKK